MNEKREVILPSDFSGEEGKIVCYRISPCPELDKELLLNGRNTKMSVELKERFLGRETPFISKADARIEQAVRVIADDIEADADMELLAVDVSRWLQVLCSKKDAVETNRVYYSGSQIQIARKTMDILTEDLSKRYSAATLAKHFGISETSLKNYFRGVYGRGYSELLNEIRMKKAAELILNNSMKISQVSDGVGFATQSRFAKAFKNYYGAAPLEYKRKHNLKKDSDNLELSDPGSDRICVYEFHERKRSGRKHETVSEFSGSDVSGSG
mgnify:CR=1 FL=1|jgi:AraC-like DNA-binding protein